LGRQEIEIWVVVARDEVLVLEVCSQGVNIILPTAGRLRVLLKVEEDGRVQVVVVSIAEVEVAAGARCIALLEAETSM
jgi:hypothetical protein